MKIQGLLSSSTSAIKLAVTPTQYTTAQLLDHSIAPEGVYKQAFSNSRDVRAIVCGNCSRSRAAMYYVRDQSVEGLYIAGNWVLCEDEEVMMGIVKKGEK